MKGKQAILRYLETHRTFTAKEVATECGMTINCITKNAIDLERSRKIVRVSKVWRTVTYRLATPEEQDGTARSCTNGLFQECRNSAAMLAKASRSRLIAPAPGDRPAPSHRTCRRLSTWRPMVWLRPTSTPTAAVAATTR